MPMDVCDREAFWEVMVEIRMDVLRSFIGDSNGELPPVLQPWMRSFDQPWYCRFDTATPAMQLAARQLLRCGFQGLPKRLFLEGKALELLSLVAQAEMERHGQGHLPTPDDVVDRVQAARALLLKRLENPPSLTDLAHLVGLNDYTLKQGFRRMFGKTVFGYLHDYRLEQAQHLLANGELSVTEVATAIGFDRSYFSTAFRKKFHLTPKQYQIQCQRTGIV
jgi:AraC-like DNA-binding protein